MSFWKSELGEVTGSQEDAFAKQFTQVPDGTMALAKIERFENQENNSNGAKYLNISWVLEDGDFRGAKVSQKVKVFDEDSKVRHRALNMLKLIYKLFNVTPKDSNPPGDQDLAVFIGKVAGIKVRETEPNAEGRQYNWVSEVHPKDGFKSETGVKLVVSRPHIESAFSRQEAIADDVPF